MPSEQILADFEFNATYFDVFSSEASRCENVIYPLLRDACRQVVQQYSLWSHKSIRADEKLSGTPDYIIANRSELGTNVLGVPLVLVVEAKQNNFAKEWGQCLAELVAAQKLKHTAFPAGLRHCHRRRTLAVWEVVWERVYSGHDTTHN